MTKEPKNKDYWQLVWLKFKTGDRLAFQEIYLEFIDHLFAYGAKITTNRELLKDCIQDLFMDLYKYNPNLNNAELLEFYLYKSLKHLIIKRLHSESRLESIHPDYNSFELTFFAEADGYQDSTGNDLIESLQMILRTLDDKKRELLFLKFYSGLNYNEIGDLLNLKPDTVKKQVYRIMQHLQVKFRSKILQLLFVCCRT